MKAKEHHVISDSLDFSAELDGCAATVNMIYNLIDSKETCSQLSDKSLCEMLHALQEHLYRISEDWLCYCVELEERIRELTKSGKTEQATLEVESGRRQDDD